MPQETKPDVEKPGEVHTSLHEAISHWRMSVFRRLENVSYYVGRSFFRRAFMPQETKPDVDKPGEVHTSLHQARSHWRMSVFRRLENVSYYVGRCFLWEPSCLRRPSQMWRSLGRSTLPFTRQDLIGE